MAIVAVLHIYAYPLGPYKVWRRPRALENHVVGKVHTYTGKGMAVVAIVEMLNFVDLFEGIYRAFKYLLFDIRHRHHEIGYMDNHGNQGEGRETKWNLVLGNGQGKLAQKKPSFKTREVMVEVEKPVAAAVKY